ncbi:MAG: coenzyme F420-0:L-glutamate ligase [Candidatus Doudnabacteria bacterium]|nr:coenzyme F420-0:L-glutamate ligase [Candidatus Doudnabacteria bacterium]
MLITPVKTRIFKTSEPLGEFIISYLPKVEDKSIIVITSKIVALSQGRRVALNNPKDKTKWIKQESEQYIRTRWCYLTLKDGHWCANAGIDESNAEGGGFILWPKDCYGTAKQLRLSLLKHYRLKNLGILITDSRIFPLRAGVTGVALSYAGFRGLRNYIGKKDLFGRKLKMTKTNVADSLASAAVLAMGEAAETCPLALVTDAMVEFNAHTNSRELRIRFEDDLYRPLFQQIPIRRKKK